MVRIAGETLHVHFLGTAGALPSPQRNPPSILIRRGSDTLLFDCGEGTQQQMMRARTGFTVNAIFITHWHADHFLGVFGLVETLAFMGRTDPLPIYGPPWVGEFVDLVQRISRHVRGFPITGHALEHGSVVPFDGYTVRAFATFTASRGLAMSWKRTSDRAGSTANRRLHWASPQVRSSGGSSAGKRSVSSVTVSRPRSDPAT